jgi:N4-gp56 family major capsid protein
MSNTSAINSELFANLVGAAQFSAYENSIARQLVTVFDMPANAGKVVQVPVWGAIAAELIADEAAASAADTNTSSQTITMKEHVVFHRVTDMLRDSAVSNVFQQLGDQSGRAIAESMDKQVFDLFTGFTEAGPGAGNELTVDHILKAVAGLRSAKLTGPFYCVVNPKVAYALKKDLIGSTNPGSAGLSNIGNQILSGGFIGQVAGVQIYESGLVSIDGSADSIGAVFHSSAIGHAMRGTIGMEEQRAAAARATDVVLTAVAGASIINSAYGLKLTADATL